MTTKKLVLDFFSAETEAECARHVYKYTDCGAWIAFHKWGIELGSIVEGADFGTAIYPLRYADKFTAADIQVRINAIEAEADAIWKWANEVVDGETAAEHGVDPPDVDFDYRHLSPSGRSS